MTKKERKKKKQIKIHNKKLLKKYPWLMPLNVWNGKKDKDYDYSHTLADWIPTGWYKCFGKMMIEEMDIARNGSTIFTQDIKEKYGSLRWYCTATNKEVYEIIAKYSTISENVCLLCGKPDVYMTTAGWYFPCCKKCWEKNKYNINPYEDVISEEDSGKMRDSYSFTRFSKEGNITTTVDISDTVEKIRLNYNRRHKNAD